MKRQIITLLLCIVALAMEAQTLKGHVYDAVSNEPLAGVNISYKTGQTAAVTNFDGAYEVKLPAGGSDLVFSYVGYKPYTLAVVVDEREVQERNVYMKESEQLMQDVVVTAGKFQQKLSDVTVSMDLLKGSDLVRQAPTDLSASLKTLPGVDIVDKQPSIRGGGGWTFGVGSRSLILIDGLSVLAPQTGDINWNNIPLQNVEQVEIIKGASSVLYGSSALNGIINVRTARPDLKPRTHISTYVGIYNDYENDSYRYYTKDFWNNDKFAVTPILRNSLYNGIRNPIYEGWEFMHSRRIGQFDFTGGVNLLTDEGYREQNYNKRLNVSTKVTYHQPGMGNRYLTYGTGLDFNSNKYGDFLIWRSASNPLSPSPYANMGREENTIRLSPFLNYNDPDRGVSHQLRTYYYFSNGQIVQASAEKGITDILGNMGTDLNTLSSALSGDVTGLLAPVMQPLLQGGLEALLSGDYTNPVLGDVVKGGFNSLHQLFPSASTADYNDLIAWTMNHGLPSNLVSSLAQGKLPQDLSSWLSGAINADQIKKDYPLDKINNWYVDYQFGKTWKNDAHITAGLTYQHLSFKSGYMEYQHQSNPDVQYDFLSDNASLYMQYDQKFFKRLSVSAGVRAEFYRVDDHYREAETKIFGTKVPFRPVFRAGLNYELAPYSHLRASFGQGYRYPSITEKFLVRNIGGASLFPNTELKAESGFNAEMGFKQGYKIGPVMGFLDVAGFFTQYHDMIEFNIGLFNSTTNTMINSVADVITMLGNGQSMAVGAQFHNVSKAQIYGVEVSTSGTCAFNPNTRIFYNIGYTFSNPIDADYKANNEREAAYTDPLQMKGKSNTSKYLKYRSKNTFKTSLDFQWKRLSLGANVNWHSRILAVDYLMIDEREQDPDQFNLMNVVRDIVLGNDGENTLAAYWQKNNTDKATFDVRVGIKVTNNVDFQFQMLNITNTEVMNRPMSLEAPRTFVAKLNIDL